MVQCHINISGDVIKNVVTWLSIKIRLITILPFSTVDEMLDILSGIDRISDET